MIPETNVQTEKLQTRARFPIVGFLLILVGAALLLEKLDVMEFGWTRILWGAVSLLGATIVIRAFISDGRGKIFWGTILFLYGLLFLLRSLRLVEDDFEVFMPASVTILGFAFLMLFVFEPKDWHLLIPSFILLAFGGAFMLTEVGLIRRWELWESVGTWWPIILILVGLSLLFRRRRA